MDDSETDLISVSVRLPETLCLDIDEYAAEQGYESRSAVVSEALAEASE
jgi:metal-responsive CopG/Arc/MetJ family transcriptional regulator